MSSVVDEFVTTPSEELLARCNKEQLVKIAEHYAISLTSDDKKLKDSLFKAVGLGLVSKGILIGPTSPVLSSASGSERDLKIREYAFEERKLQLEAARIRAEREGRAVKERELQTEVEIKKLELQHDLDLKRLQLEASENDKKREFQLQCEREERSFLLKKLEMELAIKTQVPSVASQPPQSVHTRSPVRSLGPSVSRVGENDPNVPPLDSDSSPMHSVPLGTADTSIPPPPVSVPLDPVGFAPHSHAQSVPVVSDHYFDVSRHFRMVPPFNERDIENYFVHFERVAITLRWPAEVWCLLLASVLTGKAQSVYSSLSMQQSSDYDFVKTAILNAYELVPEAYRQKFRGLRKSDRLTFVEFAREKEHAFDRWCTSQRAHSKEQLRELILLEEFKNCIPESVAMYLNDKKVTTLAHAAVCADEFVLTHRSLFYSSASRREEAPLSSTLQTARRSKTVDATKTTSEVRACFYCHDSSHLIASCPELKKKAERETTRNTVRKKDSKSAGFARSLVQFHGDTDPIFDPFILEGMVSLTGCEKDNIPVRMLRDTGSAQSFILASALPFSDSSYCGSYVRVQGIEMGLLKLPLHKVHVKSDLVSGFVKVAVCSQLPVENIHFIIGNELAHERVIPFPEVVSNALQPSDLESEIFPGCVVTRTQAHKSSTLDFETLLSLGHPVFPPDSACRLLSDTCGTEATRSECSQTAKVVRVLSTRGGAETLKSRRRQCSGVNVSRSTPQTKVIGRGPIHRSFQAGDQVLVMLPGVGSALQAKFSGPYKVKSKLTTLRYVIRTPERRRKTRVCHISLLRPYFSREIGGDVNPCPMSVSVSAASSSSPEEASLPFSNVPVSSPRPSVNPTHKATVTYLGKQVGQGRVCPVEAKVQAIWDFPRPRTNNILADTLSRATVG